MSDLKINTPLTIDQIDFRVQSVNKGGFATILAYKDSRVDMNRLDDVYGVDGWQRKHEVVNGHLFCSIGIYHERSSQWIWKQDVGTESNTEKTKGEASDAFKRAGFNMGIGRELYDYPLIQFQLTEKEFDKATGKPTWDFRLKQWAWTSEFIEGKIVLLQAIDNNGRVRFDYKTSLPDNRTAEEKLRSAATTLGELASAYSLLTPKEKLEQIELKEELKAKLTPQLKTA